MEVLVEAASELTLPMDTFVSLRVGETQKFSRLNASRTYHFPASKGAGTGKHNGRRGHLEVFKRIGAVKINLDAFEGSPDNLVVDCKDPELAKLALHIVASPAGPEETELREAREQQRREDALISAQRYIADHRLEEWLAASVHEVIKCKPANPRQFLSSQLLQEVGQQKQHVEDLRVRMRKCLLTKGHKLERNLETVLARSKDAPSQDAPPLGAKATPPGGVEDPPLEAKAAPPYNGETMEVPPGGGEAVEAKAAAPHESAKDAQVGDEKVKPRNKIDPEVVKYVESIVLRSVRGVKTMRRKRNKLITIESMNEGEGEQEHQEMDPVPT